jgi:hypothetical protein
MLQAASSFRAAGDSIAGASCGHGGGVRGCGGANALGGAECTAFGGSGAQLEKESLFSLAMGRRCSEAGVFPRVVASVSAEYFEKYVEALGGWECYGWDAGRVQGHFFEFAQVSSTLLRADPMQSAVAQGVPRDAGAY